ncbi:MAG: TM2 domain-containing protein [Gemmatimonadetes bacterium]|jgi:TM2 domain-containing membrane protein YozV|nr:TM2 domain-containing protein [Gemmatimonadota bacterium]MBT6144129.1 TM2 domain-containing protein [Gemmatimonadota bacterium]MBT7859864.1 TM2 domain-containing protein [Gemmatimonadota bacterium]
MQEAISPKSRLAAALLCGMLGVFGAHRFYVGKTGTAILQLVTLGCLGIWSTIDLILILVGAFRDDQGLLIRRWESSDEPIRAPSAHDDGPLHDQLVRLESKVTQLQGTMIEMADKMDRLERR